jgi:hypothetical protein
MCSLDKESTHPKASHYTGQHGLEITWAGLELAISASNCSVLSLQYQSAIFPCYLGNISQQFFRAIFAMSVSNCAVLSVDTQRQSCHQSHSFIPKTQERSGFSSPSINYDCYYHCYYYHHSHLHGNNKFSFKNRSSEK